MPSLFNNLVRRRGAPLLKHALGERTAAGELDREAVVMTWRNAPEVKTSGILGPEEIGYEETASGDLKEVVARTIDVPRNELPDWLTEPPYSATIATDGRKYHVAKQGCRITSTTMRLALRRDPLIQEKPLQRG